MGTIVVSSEASVQSGLVSDLGSNIESQGSSEDVEVDANAESGLDQNPSDRSSQEEFQVDLEEEEEEANAVTTGIVTTPVQDEKDDTPTKSNISPRNYASEDGQSIESVTVVQKPDGAQEGKGKIRYVLDSIANKENAKETAINLNETATEDESGDEGTAMDSFNPSEFPEIENPGLHSELTAKQSDASSQCLVTRMQAESPDRLLMNKS